MTLRVWWAYGLDRPDNKVRSCGIPPTAVIRLDEVREVVEELEICLKDIEAMQSAPAMLLVAECNVDAVTGEAEDVVVTQEYIDARWNAAIDAVERTKSLLAQLKGVGDE